MVAASENSSFGISTGLFMTSSYLKAQIALVNIVEVTHLAVLINTHRHAGLVLAQSMHAALDLFDIEIILAQKRRRHAHFRRLKETLIRAEEPPFRRRRTLALERTQVHHVQRAHVVTIIVWLEVLRDVIIG